MTSDSSPTTVAKGKAKAIDAEIAQIFSGMDAKAKEEFVTAHKAANKKLADAPEAMAGSSSTDDEGGLDINHALTGGYQSDGKPSTPYRASSGRGYRSTNSTQSGHRSRKNFVRGGNAVLDDDVFSGNRTVKQTCSAARAGAAERSTNWRSGGSSSEDERPQVKTQIQTKAGNSKGNDEPNPVVLDVIDGQNAQAYFAPSACVFIANLLATKTDMDLEVAVTKIFSRFGRVFVKIRRDDKEMPFGFIQYARDEEANHAVREGHGKAIFGRRCRLERSYANLHYFLSRHDGDTISIDFAYALMGEFGSVTQITMAQCEGVRGLDVQYEYHDAGKDAINGLRGDRNFSVHQIAAPERDADTSLFPKRAANENEIFLERYRKDCLSVFIGSLPQSANEKMLRQLLSGLGGIAEVEFFRRPSVREGYQNNVFAFVEFQDFNDVDKAIAAFHGHLVDGSTLRVVQKESQNLESLRSHGPSDSPRLQPHQAGEPMPANIYTHTPSPFNNRSARRPAAGYVSPMPFQYGGQERMFATMGTFTYPGAAQSTNLTTFNQPPGFVTDATGAGYGSPSYFTAYPPHNGSAPAYAMQGGPPIVPMQGPTQGYQGYPPAFHGGNAFPNAVQTMNGAGPPYPPCRAPFYGNNHARQSSGFNSYATGAVEKHGNVSRGARNKVNTGTAGNAAASYGTLRNIFGGMRVGSSDDGGAPHHSPEDASSNVGDPGARDEASSPVIPDTDGGAPI